LNYRDLVIGIIFILTLECVVVKWQISQDSLKLREGVDCFPH